MKRILQYFPDLTSKQTDQLEKLYDLYSDWNDKINVISRKDIDQLYTRHVLHSLAVAKFIKFQPGTKVLDIGTGGGFPGIPLAILHPDTNFTLVDSIGKKIKVVNAVAQELGLNNVTGIHERAENIHDQYDFVVSRAVTRLNRFMTWLNGKFLKNNKHEINNGVIYLKGGDLKEELSEIKQPYELTPLNNYFSEEMFEEKYIVYVPCIK